MTTRVRNKDKLVKQNIDTTLEPTEADEEILHMAYLNGAISYQFMIDEKGYTTKRFRRFKKLKHIKIHTEEVENPTTNKVEKKYLFSLSKEGRAYAAKRGWGAFCQHLNGYEHTLKGEQLLNKLVTKENISLNSIINENQQKQLYSATIDDAKEKLDILREKAQTKKEKSKIGSISVCDFLYKDDNNKLYCYEVVTDNYREHQIRNKKNYAKYVIGGEYREF